MTDLPPLTPGATAIPARTSVPLLVASTLCWIWAVLLFLVAIALGIPFISMGMYQALILTIIFLMLSAFYVVAGVGIRRRKKWGAIVGIAVAALYAALAALGLLVGLAAPEAQRGTTTTQTLLTGLLGLGVNAAIIVLGLVRWRELE